MLTIEAIALVLILVLGIPNQIIDHRHRRRKAYQPGNAWAYYAQLSREGNWEGRFMMWSTYVGIAFVVFVICHMFYALSH
ncbi:hypothetical protein MasN3_20820 [Massilia varians]|uniref:Uncharacterized protein n=1 Tax=Massilia varians TaxID=457921 RepID=A0ABM8C5U8_9BURK|nr:hypothetical protein [Massilia varians]BDT58588.1 hypothetical protein MasN3_20820 [Massilia varians]